MSHFFQKPENALKRAKELMNIPNVDDAVLKRTKRSALEILHDALVAKKHRTWQPVHEELMVLYLDICLELQLGRIAKDGLHQYRNLSIQTNPASLENVILHFVKLTEQKLMLAKRESNDLIIQAAASVDLEAAQTPEAVMLSTTSFDSSSDRTDREVVVPWLRFAWETYRTVLDILKNNTKLEALYKSVALKAFDFCVEYTRKIEFRRLCEILRNHLGGLQKHVSAPTSQSARQMRAWDGFTLDTVEKLLEVRYRQLQVASQLELFSEAFRTIDDINNIMNLVEQVPRLDLMVTYYEKLAQIFLVSKNHLFHAYALYKWYALRVAGLNGMDGGLTLASLPSLVSADEQQTMATQVVLAALSVPLVDFETASSLEEDAKVAASSEKNTRMAALLGYSTTPTRAQLLGEVEVAGVLSKAIPQVAQLFQCIERQEIDPLQIVSQIAPFLVTLRETKNVASYADSVERLVVRRVLFQLTRVYSSVTIAHLKSLLVGLTVSYEEVEQLIVRSRSLSVVAHASAPSLTSLYLKNGGASGVESSTTAATASALRTKIRIDHVQQCIRFSDAIELEANPAQLTLLGDKLSQVLARVDHTKLHTNETNVRTALFAKTRLSLPTSRQQMVDRRALIERKKEELERLQNEKLKTLEKKKSEYEQMRQQMEKERLEMDAKRRDAEKKQKIKDEIAHKETRQMLDKLGRKDLENVDFDTIDKDALIQEARDKAQKAKEAAQQKLRDSAKRLDYIIRATREAEQPILQKLVAQEKQTAKKVYEEESKAKVTIAKEQHDAALKEKARLQAALPVAAGFVATHVTRRKELYKKEAEEHKKKATLERLERRVAHAKQRYDDEQAEIRAFQEEEERLRREEEEERERERQAEIDAELRRQEEEEEELQRIAEEEKKAEAVREREAERNAGSGARGGFTSSSSSSSREPFRSERSERSERSYSSSRDEGEWTSVGPRGSAPPLRSNAPEGRWERSGPPVRAASRFGGGDRDAEPQSGDRAEGGGVGGLRRFAAASGGDRPEGGLRRFGGDRDGGDRPEGGLRRFGGGDRDRDGGDRPEGGLRRFGGDRDGGDRPEGGLRRFGGGDRDRAEGGGGLRRGGDSERASEGGEGDRFGFSTRGGAPREGAYRPPARDGDRPAREGDARRETTRAPDSGRWR